MDLKSLISAADNMPDYPIDDWQPQQKGEIDISIHADGSWWHEGSVFTRHKLVQLFSRLLSFRDGHYCLLTPVEQLTISVEKLPFVVVQTELQSDSVWLLATNVGDQIRLTRVEQMRVDMSEPDTIPEVHVRGELWASISRQSYYDMALTVESVERDNQQVAQLVSGDCVYDFGILE